MSITYADPPRERGRLVVGLPWDEFLAYMRWAWKPGQHVAMIGPTGEGKTTFAAGLLGQRRWVMALDPKGEDETLTASGFERIAHLPGDTFSPLWRIRHWQAARQWDLIHQRIAHLPGDTFSPLWRVKHWRAARQWDLIHQRIAEGKPARVIVGGPARTDAQDAANQDLMRRSFSYAREAGGWTVYVDEFELISSQRMFKLGPQVERMLISARRDGTSVVTSFQAAAWVSKHATRQARFAVIWPTGDRQMIKNVAESMGRDWRELAAAVDELPAFHVCVIPRGKSGGPFVCTSAPEL